MKNGSKKAYTGIARAAITIASLALVSSVAVAAPTSPIPQDLLKGDMQRLGLVSEPRPISPAVFLHEDGREVSLEDFKGKPTVLNFWAAWCPSCRAEMPGLSALAKTLGDDAQVLTVATGPGNGNIAQFMESISADNLPLHTDPRSGLARAFGVLGLPVTVILNSEGQEIGRLTGDAHWDTPEAEAVIRAIK